MINQSNALKISVIVPVFNEKDAVSDTLLSLQQILDRNGNEYEIIAVNDGSTDGTAEILDKIRIKNLSVVHHPANKGYGASLKTGIKRSKYDWILIIDADDTYPIEAIPNLMEKMEDYDLIIGARDVKKIPQERKHAKLFLNRFAGYLAGRKIPDLNSGLRIFRKHIVLKYWNLFPEKFSFTSTLTMVCLTHSYGTIFVPIGYHKRKGKSSLKPMDFFSFIKLVVKLSLFFNPIKVFGPISLFILLSAFSLIALYLGGILSKFPDATIIILCATALQTFFFGLLAEIITHNYK